jgi:very-long-chain (3R)-3-hydroxyacyl-CoA dehydratase
MDRIAKKKQYRKSVRAKEQEPTPDRVYLAVYNLLQTGGWSYILFLIVSHWLEHLADGDAAATAWNTVWLPLVIFQNLAILEVVHVAIGLVPSKLMTTIIQVVSRVALVAAAWLSPEGRTSWLFSLMVVSWCLTEVVRYGYYALNNPLVAGKQTPHALTVARYSMFLVLYPTGIVGELGVLFTWAQASVAPLSYVIYAIMAVYAPGSPVMYTHMMAQRRKVLKAEKEKKDE